MKKIFMMIIACFVMYSHQSDSSSPPSWESYCPTLDYHECGNWSNCAWDGENSRCFYGTYGPA